MLQAAGIVEDLMSGTVVSADGRTHFMAAVKEFEDGDLDARLLEILCCNGCIMGPGMGSPEPLYSRRARVSRYVRDTQAKRDHSALKVQVADFADLDLSRSFKADDQRIPVRDSDAIACILESMGKFRPEDELNCGACGYESCREHALAIYKGLAESEMCLPYTIDRLRAAVTELADSNSELASTREALVHSEKMASMGQLAAGIAHEVNNPLGVVLMYAHMLLDEHQSDPRFAEDLRMIVEQTDRCKKIVAGLLGFARQNKVVREPVDIRTIVERSLATLPAPENIRVEVRHDIADAVAELDRDQVIQVITNLVTNAYGAMPDGGTLTILTHGDPATVRISVTDTGTGIPREIIDKIFEPFFSTKKIGKGTGLGLAVTYGIVKMHYGSIDVKSNADSSVAPTGTTFTVTFPRHGRED
jgi:signal transduction histidine kinase